jgi:lysozyme
VEVHYGVDGSSGQGRMPWDVIDEGTAFGWEKFTEGTGYVNPYAADAKTQMIARKKATGFVPGGYMFLLEGNGAAQAQWFAEQAGDMSELGIAVDIEPEPRIGSFPAMADALACVRELRTLFPGHPIGGYIPPWYWGHQRATFVDWRWASIYVGGIGNYKTLYDRVPASFWYGYYGGGAVNLLQYTSTAVVPGAPGLVDCSAFRGTIAEYAAMVLPHAAPPPPPPQPAEKWQIDMMHRLPTLKHGSTRHHDVLRAQALMLATGAQMVVEPGVSALDGQYGPVTEAAVKQVQHAHSLPVDGVIGPRTWAVLVTGADL